MTSSSFSLFFVMFLRNFCFLSSRRMCIVRFSQLGVRTFIQSDQSWLVPVWSSGERILRPPFLEGVRRANAALLFGWSFQSAQVAVIPRSSFLFFVGKAPRPVWSGRETRICSVYLVRWRGILFAAEDTQANKPGTAQVGAISKAQKDSRTKTTFSTTGDNKSSQKN